MNETLAQKKKEEEIKEVVLIDDDEEWRKPQVDFLEGLGYKVTEIDSGTAVSRVLESKSWSWVPSAVVIDLVIPGTSGYDIIRRFNQRYKSHDVPLIVVSRLTTRDDIVESELAGAHCFVAKPHKPEVLQKCFEFCEANFAKPIEDQQKTIEIFR